MKYTLDFRGVEDFKNKKRTTLYHINNDGYNQIQNIRLSTNINFRIDQITNDSLCYSTSYHEIDITDEDFIQLIPHFSNDNYIFIEVKGSFNKYHYYDINIQYVPTPFFMLNRCKKIHRVTLYHRLKNNMIISDWINDGCPLEWDISNKE